MTIDEIRKCVENAESRPTPISGYMEFDGIVFPTLSTTTNDGMPLFIVDYPDSPPKR